MEFYDPPKDAEFQGHVDNIIGTKYDTLNLYDLFHGRLNYKFFPKKTMYPRTRWSKKDILDFVHAKAKLFADNLFDEKENVNGFDSLIFSISGHGFNQNIITSDYGLIAKKTFYRAFSDPYPKARKFPRVFIFDACEGVETIAKGMSMKNKKQRVHRAETTLAKVGNDNDSDDGELWKPGDENTDWNIAILNSSNLDYQSFLNTDKGSKLIFGFYDRAIKCLDMGKPVRLSPIFKDIAADLSKHSQLPVFTWVGDTEYLVLEKNENGDWNPVDEEEKMDEMVTVVGNKVEVELANIQKAKELSDPPPSNSDIVLVYDNVKD